jgi:hypothetical protein
MGRFLTQVFEKHSSNKLIQIIIPLAKSVIYKLDKPLRRQV